MIEITYHDGQFHAQRDGETLCSGGKSEVEAWLDWSESMHAADRSAQDGSQAAALFS